MSFNRRTFIKTLAALPLAASQNTLMGTAYANQDKPQEKISSATGVRSLVLHSKDEGRAVLFNEQTPGPTLRFEGLQNPASVLFENKLNTSARILVHGLGAGAITQGTSNGIPDNAEQLLSFRAPRPGTYIYRAESPNDAESFWAKGAIGTFIVPEGAPDVFTHDIIIPLNTGSASEPLPADLNARSFAYPLIANGYADAPLKLRPNARVRLRFVNLSPWRVAALRLEGLDVTVIALDGRAVVPFIPARNLLIMAPGARTDITFDCPSDANASGKPMTIFSRAPGTETALIKIVLEGLRVEDNRTGRFSGLPIPSFAESIPLQDALRPTLRIENGKLSAEFNGRFHIEKAAQEMPLTDKPFFEVKTGKPVVIALENKDLAATSLHIEKASIRLLHPLDDGWEPYWLDTILAAGERASRGAFLAEEPGDYRMRIRSALPESPSFWLRYRVTA